MPVETELILDYLDPEWRERFRDDKNKARQYYETYAAERWREASRWVQTGRSGERDPEVPTDVSGNGPR